VLKELIEDNQEAEFIIALFGSSERYELREEFKRIELPADKR